MTSYDPVTGQISLARNDKYWGTPPGPAAAVLRLGDPADLLAAFSRGDVQALWFAPSGSMAPQVGASGSRRPPNGGADPGLGATRLQHGRRRDRRSRRCAAPSRPG